MESQPQIPELLREVRLKLLNFCRKSESQPQIPITSQPQIPECLLKVSLKFLNEAQRISFTVYISNFEKGECVCVWGGGGGVGGHIAFDFPPRLGLMHTL